MASVAVARLIEERQIPYFPSFCTEFVTSLGTTRSEPETHLESTRWHAWARLALVALLAMHSRSWMGDPTLGPQDGQWLLHGVELGIHETGHILMPFGETLHIAGGSLFQFIVPMVFAIAFWRRGDRFAAAICGWWLAVSAWDVAIYIADARVQELDLVGGGEHDWGALLEQWGKIKDAESLGRAMTRMGTMLAVFSLGVATLLAFAKLRPASNVPQSSKG